jgi:hypothetical protein
MRTSEQHDVYNQFGYKQSLRPSGALQAFLGITDISYQTYIFMAASAKQFSIFLRLITHSSFL